MNQFEYQQKKQQTTRQSQTNNKPSQIKMATSRNYNVNQKH